MADEVGNGDDVVLPVGKEAVDRLIRENSEIFSDSQCKVCCAALISESQKLAHYQSKKHANKVRRYMSMPQGEEFTPPKKMKPAETVTGDEEDRNKLCPVCNMTFSSPVVAQSHYQGKTHAKNLKMKEQGVITEAVPVKRVPKPVPNPLAKPASNVSTKVDEDDPEKFCKLCRATFNNPHMSQQHYMGKKHKKQETKNEIMTTYKKSGNSLPQTADIKPAVPGSTTAGKGYSCDICNIVLNSIEQHQAHISGSKHKNQLNSMMPNFSAPLDMHSPPNGRKTTLSSFDGFASTGGLSSTGSLSSTEGLSSTGSYLSSGGFSSTRNFSFSRPFQSSGSYLLSGGLSSTSGFSSTSGLSSTSGFSSSNSLSSTGGFSSSGSLSGRPGTMSSLLSSPYPSTRYNQPYVREDVMRPSGYNDFNKHY